LKQASGFRGKRSKLFRQATEAVDRAMVMATQHRKVKKRSYRALWIVRINAAARLVGTTYSRLIHAMAKKSIVIDRKMLADLAVNDLAAFGAIAKTALA
jgi:large subunit ribosomal protein L20